jgi:hypothetical protein
MVREKRCITQIKPDQVTPVIRSLIDPTDPASLRCFAVMDGDTLGRIFTNHAQDPAWVVVQEIAFGSLYLGGNIQHPLLRRLITRLRRKGHVLIGLWSDDPRWKLIPQGVDYSGFTVDFTDRQPYLTIETLPKVSDGCKLQRMDLPLFESSAGKSLYLAMYGSAQQALEKGYGICLMNHHEVLCEAFAGPFAQGSVEIGTQTHLAHRRKGYATLTCAYLISEMERMGFRTYWNCAKDNQASIALARRLGFQFEKEYRLVAWRKIDA